jgi:hypothetical protein
MIAPGMPSLGDNGLKASDRLARAALTVVLVAVTAAVLPHASQSRTENDEVAFPVGYRSWSHVKSALIGPESLIFARYGGLHHIYANDIAMEGYRTSEFPDGSVIVFDLLETRESGGVTSEGPRRFIDVMVKDSKRYAETGGWGFEEFKGDSQTERVLSAAAKTACYKCHEQRKNHGFVFSSVRK